MKYTVVGLYYDNKQVRVDHVEAGGAADAAAKAKRAALDAQELGAELDECGRCDGSGEEPGSAASSEETVLCLKCLGSKVEVPIAVLAIFEGKHRDVYGGDELLQN